MQSYCAFGLCHLQDRTNFPSPWHASISPVAGIHHKHHLEAHIRCSLVQGGKQSLDQVCRCSLFRGAGSLWSLLSSGVSSSGVSLLSSGSGGQAVSGSGVSLLFSGQGSRQSLIIVIWFRGTGSLWIRFVNTIMNILLWMFLPITLTTF